MSFGGICLGGKESGLLVGECVSCFFGTCWRWDEMRWYGWVHELGKGGEAVDGWIDGNG